VNQVCPSIACRVLAKIQQTHSGCQAQAFDILATCSGYLFAMQIACDYLHQRPGAAVLVVTAEALTPLVNPEDFGSCISFGDAATATWCTAGVDDVDSSGASTFLRLERPLCFSEGDGEGLLTVPPMGQKEKIAMQGAAVRRLTVPAMSRALRLAAQQGGLSVGDLDLVIPHQTNRRIISDLALELGIAGEKMFLNLKKLGNTSSCTLPLAMSEYAGGKAIAGKRVGFVAVGGGFTYAAAIGHIKGTGQSE
jgi:3-oxoacyl-(acyl-carrier-protein) synthase III